MEVLEVLIIVGEKLKQAENFHKWVCPWRQKMSHRVEERAKVLGALKGVWRKKGLPVNV